MRLGHIIDVPLKTFSRYRRLKETLAKSVANRNQTTTCGLMIQERQSHSFPPLPDKIELQEKHECLRKQVGSHRGFYIIDDKLADDLACNIPNIQDKIVIECNPGPGILTRKLLMAGAKRVVALETHKEFQPYIEELQHSVSHQRLTYYPDISFFRLHKYHVHGFKDTSGNMIDMFEDVTPQEFGKGCGVSVVGVVPPTLWTNTHWHLIHSAVRKESIFRCGKVLFHFYLSGKDVQLMTLENYSANSKMWSARTICSQLFFDTKVIKKVPNDSFCPSVKVGMKNVSKTIELFKATPERIKWDKCNMYLVQFSPKSDLSQYEKWITEGKNEFISFINYLAKRQNTRLIPFIEQWAPNRGLELIKMGYTMNHMVKHLLPQDYTLIFKAFSSLPEYQRSGFQAALQDLDRFL